MNAMRVLLSRLRGLFAKDRSERELEDELEFHFEQEVRLHLSRGMTPEEARAAARKRFGGLDRAKETYRDARGFRLLENFIRDLHFGARMLRGNPGFTAAAVLSLGLGIGINCAVFTLANAALFRDLAIDEPDRLARISVSLKGRGRDLDYPAFREISQRQTSFTDLAASGGLRLQHVVFNGQELQELGRIQGRFVSANYFDVLGVKAARGRLFAPEDSARPGEGAVAVVSHGFWESRLSGDASVVGQSITLNGVPLTIVGVLTRDFTGDQIGRPHDVFVPIFMQPRFQSRNMLESATATFFATLGRLKPGVTESQAAAEITGLYQQVLAAQNTADTSTRILRSDPSEWRAIVTAGSAAWNPALRYSEPLTFLMSATGLVLLIACCNVANLLLARGAARRHEIGTRLALGSSRGRLITQLLTESLLLSVLGGALGFALAQGSQRFLNAVSADVLYLVLDLQPDGRVFAFAAAVSLATTLIFGVVPAVQASAMKLSQATRGAVAAGMFRLRTTRGLVIAQVALSLWLLIGAGLLARSVWNLRAFDIGLDRANVTTFSLTPEPGLNPSGYEALHREVEQRVAALPGVKSVAFSNYGLFSKGGLTAPARVPFSNTDPAGDRDVYMGFASPGFFAAVGMELALGRDFTERDSGSSVGIVSESVARHYFGDRSPIGESIYFPGLDGQNRYIPFSEGLDRARRYEIVGVARDAFDRGPRNDPTYRIYLPIAHNERFAETLYVRSQDDSDDAVIPVVMGTLREFASRIRLEEVMTLEWQLNQNYPLETLGARLLSLFGGMALFLAGIGLFGVMSYSVTRRTGEIGVRMALGAQRGRVLAMVLRETLRMVAVGVVIGVAAAVATTRFLASFLYGLTPTDPATIIAVSAILILIGALAGYIPARRASRVDPLTALRHE